MWPAAWIARCEDGSVDGSQPASADGTGCCVNGSGSSVAARRRTTLTISLPSTASIEQAKSRAILPEPRNPQLRTMAECTPRRGNPGRRGGGARCTRPRAARLGCAAFHRAPGRPRPRAAHFALPLNRNTYGSTAAPGRPRARCWYRKKSSRDGRAAAVLLPAVRSRAVTARCGRDAALHHVGPGDMYVY